MADNSIGHTTSNSPDNENNQIPVTQHQTTTLNTAGMNLYSGDEQKDLLYPPENAFYLVGFDQRADREKLYKAIKGEG